MSNDNTQEPATPSPASAGSPQDWISVTRRLPEQSVWVLVSTDESDVEIGWMDRGKWERLGYDPEFGASLSVVTHWMPLPASAQTSELVEAKD